MRRKNIALTASAGIAAGALGLTSLALPAGAQDPNLPRATAQDLVSSVLEPDTPAMSGKVTVDNNLGLPAVPGMGGSGQFLSEGERSLRVWSNGEQGHRMSVPQDNGEITVVDDGNTLWKWDSSERTVVRHHTAEQRSGSDSGSTGAEPTELARNIVGKLRESSSVTVDGTTSVAGRDAYELVLAPKPSERTKLREVRIAVGAEHRIPLRVEVNTNGSTDPALRAGFSRIDFGPQDPELFQFTPPADARVRTGEAHEDTEPRGNAQHHGEKPEFRTMGEGWDTVVTAKLPAEAVRGGQQGSSGKRNDGKNVRGLLERIGEPVSGSWGNGWAVDTSVGSAVVTSDGRVVAGAVPRQVLTEALKEA